MVNGPRETGIERDTHESGVGRLDLDGLRTRMRDERMSRSRAGRGTRSATTRLPAMEEMLFVVVDAIGVQVDAVGGLEEDGGKASGRCVGMLSHAA